MNKKVAAILASAVVVSGVVGYFAPKVIKKFKKEKPALDIQSRLQCMQKEEVVLNPVEELVPEPECDSVEETKETCEEIIAENHYAVTEDDDVEDANDKEEMNQYEDYISENQGKITKLTLMEWEDPYGDIPYDKIEAYYYPETDELITENGDYLYPFEKYVGNILLKIRFRTSDDKVTYIRNHPLETDYRIIKREGSPDNYD